MCGIIGYAGKRQAAPILLEGLSKLEYRGYDSAGVCVCTESGLEVAKAAGRLQILKDKMQGGRTIKGAVGIGHTRWATHGAPTDVNSHPHLSASGKISLVHNGIIENEAALRAWLREQGISCRSQTDSEVAANLVGYFYEQGCDFVTAVRRAAERLEGSYALAILCADQPDTIVAIKKDSPLIFGFGQTENFVASDVTAVLQHTRDVSYLEDGEMAVFTAHSVTFYNAQGHATEKERVQITWEQSAAERGGYDHFMYKEIMEQPKAIRDTLSGRIQNGRVELAELALPKQQLQTLRRIYAVGCGSAYYVALLAKYTLEKLCRIPTEAVLASEFRYAEPVIGADSLVILISQSGETADTLAALQEAKKHNARTLAIVNVAGSAIARQAHHVLYTRAGPEISVATTKAFSTQLAAVYLLALYVAAELDTVQTDVYNAIVQALENLPAAVEKTLCPQMLERCRHLACQFKDRQNAFFVGRNTDSAVCREGSLKLKEVAYLHSQAYPAGELKHGPISLIEEGTLVVAVNTVRDLFPKTMANIKEVKARGASVLCVVTEEMEDMARTVADGCVCVPCIHPVLQPSLSLLPLQVFAYHMALDRGCDVDKPRNLAKSVTVE